MSRFSDWIDSRLPYRDFFRRHFLEYRVPNNLNFFYVFGVLLVLVLTIQAVSGIWLMFFYTPSANAAFDSVQTLLRDVNWGWLFRYTHTTGASFLFVLLYLHLFRGIWYGSYRKPRELVWLLGMGLFVLLILQACLGYVLPWGQLSYWGAQVFTSFLTAIPYVGEKILIWFRGDYVVSDITLHRFYVLHTLILPAIVFFIIKAHLRALRHVGSTNPTRKPLPDSAYIPFHPFYTIKDGLASAVFLFLFFTVVCFFPTMWGYFIEPLNSLPADPSITPNHIHPLWYVAPFYAILRAVPSKEWGIVLFCLSIGVLFCLPWLHRSERSCGLLRFSALVFSLIGLGVLGLLEMTPWTVWLTRVVILIYFGAFVTLR